jgi:hypothetical protein
MPLLLGAGAVCSHSHWLPGVGAQDHSQLHGPIQGAATRGGQHGAVTSVVLQLLNVQESWQLQLQSK